VRVCLVTRAMACFAAAPGRAWLGNAPRVVSSGRSKGGNKTRLVTGRLRRPSARQPVCHAFAPSELAQFALRDDYDPVVFLFCANALFLSVLLNVLNFGLDRDATTGDISVPPGGVREMFARTKNGLVKSFSSYAKLPLFMQYPVFMTPELTAAVGELKVAKKNAFNARGTPAAQETAEAFQRARRKCVGLGLSEDSSLLASASAEEKP
jgi:hypothetical protein